MEANSNTVEPHPIQHVATAHTASAPTQPLVRSFGSPKKRSKIMPQMIIVSLLVVIAGLGTGYALSRGTTASTDTPNVASESQTASGANEAGVNDESAFKDTAEGTLVDGGIDGEGTHHLERAGGPSKYVYISSTVLNLDSYVGKKVQIWGQTISGRKAGWLMDVGKIKLLE